MSLKSRLLIGMAMALAMAIAAGVVLSLSTSRLNQAMEDRRKTHEVSHHVFELDLLYGNYMLYNEAETVELWRSKHESIVSMLEGLRSYSEEEIQMLATMSACCAALGDAFPQLVSNYEQHMAGEVEPSIYVQREQGLREQILRESQVLVEEASRLDTNALARTTSAENAATIWNTTFIALLFCVIIGVCVLIIRSVVRPVNELKHGTEALAVGNLDYRVGMVSHDELGDLARSFDHMAGELNDSYLALVEEIGERMLLEEELRRSEGKYRTLVENLPQKIFLKDTDSVYVSCNENYADDLGLTPEMVVGKSDFDFFPIELAEKYRNDDRRVMEAGVTETIEESYIEKGKEAYVMTAKTPVRDEEGNTIGILGIFWDITERVRAEKELERYREHLEELVRERTRELDRSNKELEQFAYVASHDLQEPLNTISSYLRLIERRYKGRLDTDANEFIAFAVDGAMRMSDMIDDLLAFSRVETRGKEFAAVDVEEVLEDVVKGLEVSIAGSGAEITSEPLPTVWADRAQLAQLFQNLVANAIKFKGKERPRVHIGAEKKGSEWVFSVSDNGIGIEPQYRERIFSIFERLHSRDSYTGTGIGLALARKIAERHGGRIWVESEPGEGSTFYFTIADLRGVEEHGS
jgi:PAS domain S-box-containing protein